MEGNIRSPSGGCPRPSIKRANSDPGHHHKSKKGKKKAARVPESVINLRDRSEKALKETRILRAEIIEKIEELNDLSNDWERIMVDAGKTKYEHEIWKRCPNIREGWMNPGVWSPARAARQDVQPQMATPRSVRMQQPEPYMPIIQVPHSHIPQYVAMQGPYMPQIVDMQLREPYMPPFVRPRPKEPYIPSLEFKLRRAEEAVRRRRHGVYATEFYDIKKLSGSPEIIEFISDRRRAEIEEWLFSLPDEFMWHNWPDMDPIPYV